MIQRLWRAIPGLYCIWAVPLLLSMAWLTPAWQSPDEPAHFQRAVQVAEGGVLGVRRGSVAGGKIASGIFWAFWPFNVLVGQGRLTPAIEAAGDASVWGPASFNTFPNTAQYPPVFYLPDALAIRIGMAKRWTVNATLLVARMLNACVAASVTVAALYFARRTRIALLCLAMLPMTLGLFSSASQDALLLATGFLAVGLLDGVIEAGRDAKPSEMWLLVGLLILIGIARPPYIALGLLGLLAMRRLGQRAILAAGVAILVVLAWSALVAWRVTVPMYGIEPMRQLRYLLAHPGDGFDMLTRSYAQQSCILWREAMGKLGWLDTPMESWYYRLTQIVLGLGLVAALGGRSRRAWVPWLCVVGAIIALALTEWLTWTQSGALVVDGLQGRYFIVPMAVLVLGMPGIPALRPFVVPPALLGAAVLALATPYEIVHALVLRYYLH